MELTDVAVVVIGPLLTAAVAGIGVLINEWRTQRRWEVRQRAILERGLQEVTFIGQWSAAYGSISADDPQRDARVGRALADLERTYREVENGLNCARDDRPERWDLASSLRLVALRGVQRPGARIVRALYYLGLVWVVFASITMLAVDVDGGLTFQVLTAATLTLAYSLPVWALHRWARWLDRSTTAD